MILYIVNGIVQWLHEDVSIKEQEQFINDNNCVVIDRKLELPIAPDDDKVRVLKYNAETKELYYEVVGVKELTHEELTEVTYKQSSSNAEDNLINMELGTDTNQKVTMTNTDALTLMELMLGIDEKLTQLLNPKQV